MTLYSREQQTGLRRFIPSQPSFQHSSDARLLTDEDVRAYLGASAGSIAWGRDGRRVREIIGLRELHCFTDVADAKRADFLAQIRAAIAPAIIDPRRTRRDDSHSDQESLSAALNALSRIVETRRRSLEKFLSSGDSGLEMTGEALRLDDELRGVTRACADAIAICSLALDGGGCRNARVQLRTILARLAASQDPARPVKRVLYGSSERRESLVGDRYGIATIARILEVQKDGPAAIARGLQQMWKSSIGISHPSFQSLYAWMTGQSKPREESLVTVFRNSFASAKTDSQRVAIAAIANDVFKRAISLV